MLFRYNAIFFKFIFFIDSLKFQLYKSYDSVVFIFLCHLKEEKVNDVK